MCIEPSLCVSVCKEEGAAAVQRRGDEERRVKMGGGACAILVWRLRSAGAPAKSDALAH